VEATLLVALSALAAASPAILGVDRPADEVVVAEAVARSGGALRRCFVAAGVCTADFPGDPPIDALRALPFVRYAHRDALIGPMPTSSAVATADCPDPWDMVAVRAVDAWAVADGGSGPLVAVQDSGFRVSHEDLVGAVNSQWDYGNGDAIAEVEPSSGVPGHGTFIAGVIAARDNEVGRSGVAPGCQLYLQKIADDRGALYFSYAIDALGNLATSGADRVRVLNYSIASTSYDAGLADAIEALGSLDNGGVVVVAAAANCSSPYCGDADNDASPVYPANLDFPHVLSVANHDRDGSLNPYSHYGAETVDLAAPGTDLCSLDVGSDGAYLVASGTSYAAPMVAGAAALVLDAHPDLTAAEVVRIVRASVVAEAALAGRVATGGRLDAWRAVNTALPRLSAVDDVSFVDEGAFVLGVEGPAAEGVVAALVLHGPSLTVRDGAGYVVTRVGAGGTVEVPGEGEVTVPTDGALVVAELPAHASTVIEVGLEAVEEADVDVTIRVVASSEGAAAVVAPVDGAADATGAPALGFHVAATVTPPEDTGGPTETGAPADSEEETETESEVPVDSGPGAADSGSEPKEPTGCGCASSGSGAVGWSGGLLVALAASRRGRGARQGAEARPTR
jgi:subtilisin family serine protease